MAVPPANRVRDVASLLADKTTSVLSAAAGCFAALFPPPCFYINELLHNLSLQGNRKEEIKWQQWRAAIMEGSVEQICD